MKQINNENGMPAGSVLPASVHSTSRQFHPEQMRCIDLYVTITSC